MQSQRCPPPMSSLSYTPCCLHAVLPPLSAGLSSSTLFMADYRSYAQMHVAILLAPRRCLLLQDTASWHPDPPAAPTFTPAQPPAKPCCSPHHYRSRATPHCTFLMLNTIAASSRSLLRLPAASASPIAAPGAP
eukprot:7002296-Pyramimonas_sp.AAC.1